MKVEEEMSQHLYTSISVFRYWQNAAKLTEQKVRFDAKRPEMAARNGYGPVAPLPARGLHIDDKAILHIAF